MARLKEDVLKGLVDKDIVDIVEAVNRRAEYYTTSSCSGRIIVIAAYTPGDKPGAIILGKWHRKIEGFELAEAVGNLPPNTRLAWASAQGPILHVAARDLEAAGRMLRIGLTAGFKHSCIHVLSDRRIIVELRSAERIDIPLVFLGTPTGISVEKAATILNYYLSLGKSRLSRLRRAISLGL